MDCCLPDLISFAAQAKEKKPVLKYTIDLTKSVDSFYVTLTISGQLNASDSIFQFAATALGTYQLMNIGQYVGAFEAFDKAGHPLKVESTSIDQFYLHSPDRIRTIRYNIGETFRKGVHGSRIYMMAASNIDDHYALLNFHNIVGFIGGRQHLPTRRGRFLFFKLTPGTELQ